LLMVNQNLQHEIWSLHMLLYIYSTRKLEIWSSLIFEQKAPTNSRDLKFVHVESTGSRPFVRSFSRGRGLARVVPSQCPAFSPASGISHNNSTRSRESCNCQVAQDMTRHLPCIFSQYSCLSFEGMFAHVCKQ
jgi:hypothetical protein